MESTSGSHVLPVLFTRGTNFEIGFNIGKTFGTVIKDFLKELKFYQEISLPLFNLPVGKREYDRVLCICKDQYPEYVREIEGMASGAGIEFYELFILHVENLMTAEQVPPPSSDLGCTDIMCNNKDEVIMGHTEDAYPECQGRAYIVHAEVLNDADEVVEQFCSLSYPGFLPGYTMGYNNFGMVHTINTVNPAQRNPTGTPREFLARALLGAKSLDNALKVLRNSDYGIADGFNVNIFFAKADGPKVVYSIEVGPKQDGQNESQIDILEIPVGDSYFHCNRYVRLPIKNTPNFFATSTDHRQVALDKLPKAKTVNDVRTQLSDKSNSEWPVYRTGVGKDKGKTVLTGIFDTSNQSWSIYTGPSASTKPVAVLRMNY